MHLLGGLNWKEELNRALTAATVNLCKCHTTTHNNVYSQITQIKSQQFIYNEQADQMKK